MIAYIKGMILSKTETEAVIENSGIGYTVNMCQNSLDKLPSGRETEIYVAQSFSMYEGQILYGFISREEKKLFELFRNSIPGTGAKKSLEYLNKVSKSISEFKKTVAKKDVKTMASVFGFTSKTAEKIITSLKDKIGEINIQGQQTPETLESEGKFETVAGALVSLGYRPSAAREALREALSENGEKESSQEELIKSALRKLSK